jgi:hypothetical protein
MGRNKLKSTLLIIFSLLIVGCNVGKSSSSSSVISTEEQTALYKAAIGRIYHTSIDDFATSLSVCDLSIVNNVVNSEIELTLNNCKEKLKMVDLLMVNYDELKEESTIIYPHYGLKWSEDFINVVPNTEEGTHELVLKMKVNQVPENVIVLLSYFEESEGFERRIEHYLKFAGNNIVNKGD